MSVQTIIPDVSKDLHGVSCPMNLVYTKVELSRMTSGQVLEVILDDGAPVNNVPVSVEKEGHQVIGREQLADKAWSILVRRK